MRIRLLSILIIICFIGYGQNWNVFNKNYRYNYKLNNSQLISNVLFAETISVLTSADTVYNLNRIGVVTGNTLTSNQPQFLQLTIVKKLDGSVKFQSPGNITIPPTLTLTQTWLYDSNLNYSATCVSISTVNIFSTVDSVKTIIVNSSDSVLLSKQFGIIMYPKDYGLNQYYRLAGIENKATYDQTALFGEKVPNAWDFYDHDVGYSWCSETKLFTGQQYPQSCETAIYAITGKTLAANTYSYSVTKKFYTANFFWACSGFSSTPAMTTTNIAVEYPGSGGLTSGLIENRMYPGMVHMVAYGVNLVGLGKDNLGRVYKYVGKPCGSWGVTMPDQNEAVGYTQAGPSSLNTYTLGVTPAGSPDNSLVFGSGLGLLSQIDNQLSVYHYCKTCYGTVNSPVFEKIILDGNVFPNPANTQITLPVNYARVKLYDHLGRFLKGEILDSKNTLDISSLPNGLYFLEIQSDSFKSTQKLIIQH